jgi:oligoendopeptidase F
MKKTAAKPKHEWNLGLLYKSLKDPQIEKDVANAERLYAEFAKKYDTKEKKCLIDAKKLLPVLTDYEKMSADASMRPIMYFTYLSHMDSRNNEAASQISLLTNRLTKAANQIIFFEIALGTIGADLQKHFLADKSLLHFKVLLQRIFDDAKHTLTIAEEKIINLKSLPAQSMWVTGLNRAVSEQTVKWKGKTMPLPEAHGMVQTLSLAKDRQALGEVVVETLKKVSVFAEAEINAVFTDKKINDELRNYKTASEATIRGYRNDPKVIEKLVRTVTEANSVAHKFYALKARLLKQKKLSYSDRAAKIGKVKTKFTFDESAKLLKKVLASLDPKYPEILQSYLDNGQIDAFPRVGKRGGAYCSGSYGDPTFVLLNHLDDLHSFTTLAHEMGHAFHTELSNVQGPIYGNYSTALAETASTLFEAIALDAVFEILPDKEKIIVLHDKINDDVATVFRQIACFNFETDIHKTIRETGFISKDKLNELHNKNMQAYLGPVFDIKPDDGYLWVTWWHLRYFFYVYSYAYGQLVSKALLRRYRADKTFWKSIEKFLSAGGKASPEEILAEIGIDVSSPEFWMDGIHEIEDDIKKLEKLAKLV